VGKSKVRMKLFQVDCKSPICLLSGHQTSLYSDQRKERGDSSSGDSLEHLQLTANERIELGIRRDSKAHIAFDLGRNIRKRLPDEFLELVICKFFMGESREWKTTFGWIRESNKMRVHLEVTRKALYWARQT